MFMYINSPGGSVTAGFAMFDTMRHVKSEISTINVGLAASMGSLLLTGGEKGKRLALPNSRVMIHQPSGQAQGQATDIQIDAEEVLKIKASLVADYAQMTGQTREVITKALDRDNYMSAQEAVEFGLVDQARARAPRAARAPWPPRAPCAVPQVPPACAPPQIVYSV